MEKNRRQIQAEQTKEHIMRTVQEMVSQRPLSQLTIRDICGKAGISPGAFYHYFDCKEAAILYGYRSVDLEFHKLARNGTPLENIREIIHLQLGLLNNDSLDATKALYISHLVYYDAYFFDEERPIFQGLLQDVSAFTGLRPGQPELDRLVWKILRFCRGILYNACIDPAKVMVNWPEAQVEEAMQYLEFLCNSKLV